MSFTLSTINGYKKLQLLFFVCEMYHLHHDSPLQRPFVPITPSPAAHLTLKPCSHYLPQHQYNTASDDKIHWQG